MHRAGRRTTRTVLVLFLGLAAGNVPQLGAAPATAAEAWFKLPPLPKSKNKLEARVRQVEAIGHELAEARRTMAENHPRVVFLEKNFQRLAKKAIADIKTTMDELKDLDDLLAGVDEPNDPGRQGTTADIKALKKMMATGYLGNLCLDKRVTLDLGGGVRMTLALIPVGRLTMGSAAAEKGRGRDEGPLRAAAIPKVFYMGIHEITQAQYSAIMGGTRSHFKGAGRPVETVTWKEAVKFCREFSDKVGTKVRLPTEAEWEYACRAGTKTPFNTGHTISADHANYDANYMYGNGKRGPYRMETTPAGQCTPNAWGLHDMHGNVSEWCSDAYAAYPGGETNGPVRTEKGAPYHVCRGGNWQSYPWDCRSAVRGSKGPKYKDRLIGFRVVWMPDERVWEKNREAKNEMP